MRMAGLYFAKRSVWSFILPTAIASIYNGAIPSKRAGGGPFRAHGYYQQRRLHLL
jgi:hypothetical protein